MASHKVNWNDLETEYVTGDISLEKLAEKHGVDIRTAKRHSKEAGWVEKKRIFCHRIATEVREKVSTLEIEVRARHMETAKLMRGLSLMDLDAKNDPAGQNKRALNEQLQKDPTERRLWLKDAAEIERRALGIPDVDPRDMSRLTDDELRRLAEGKGGGGTGT